MNHLPHPTLGTNNQHYKKFSEDFGTQTTEDARPSPKSSKDHGNKIQFNPVKQHSSNTGLTIDCMECSKLQLVHTTKKSMEAEKRSFNFMMSCMM